MLRAANGKCANRKANDHMDVCLMCIMIEDMNVKISECIDCSMKICMIIFAS